MELRILAVVSELLTMKSSQRHVDLHYPKSVKAIHLMDLLCVTGCHSETKIRPLGLCDLHIKRSTLDFGESSILAS